MVIKNKNNGKKWLLLVFTIIFILGLIGTAYWFNSSKDEPQNPTDTEAINYDPPTDEDAQDVQNRKEEIVKEDQDEQAQSSTKKEITPILTEASKTRVFGYIGGVVEEGGSCTFTFTGNGTVVKKSGGVADVSKTNCATTPPNGTGWSVILSYNSITASGKSQARNVE